MLSKHFTLLLVCVSLHVTAFAQNKSEQLVNYISSLPQEKVYISTDRNTYVIGENLWFSAHLVNAIDHRASAISKILYVDLIDEKENIILDTRHIEIKNGFGKGDFVLSDDLREGKYTLRAYTKYMLNFPEAFLFTKPIYVLATQEQPDNKSKKRRKKKEVDTSLPIIAQFFPEGGHLVDGLFSKVAFKITDTSAQNLSLTNGFLVDEANTFVTRIEPTHDGMGMFALIPSASKRYFAKLKFGPEELVVELPKVKAEGSSLSADVSDNILQVNVHANATSLKGHEIMIALRGQPVHYSEITQETLHYQENLFTDDFGEGVAQITLFDPEGRPVAERLVYIEKASSIESSIEVEGNLKPSSSMMVQPKITNKKGEKIDGNYSLSIIDTRFAETDNFSIKTYLLLTSDLRGKINNPDAYFDENLPSYLRKYNLDLLMRTHGWRRFSWQNVVEPDSQPILYIPETNGYNLDFVLHKPNYPDKPLEANLVLTTLNPFSSGETQSLEDGSVTFLGLDTPDTTAVFLKANFGAPHKVKKNKKIKEVYDYIGITHQEVEPEIQPALSISPVQQEYIETTRKEIDADPLIRTQFFEILIEEVKITGTSAEVMRRTRRSRRYYGFPTRRIVSEDPRFKNASVLDMFRSIAGLNVFGSPGNPQIFFRTRGNTTGDNRPLFLLDGFPAPVEVVTQYTSDEVDFIDVLRRSDAAIYGQQGRNGVIAVFLKEGVEFNRARPSAGTMSLKLPGYYSAREYYNPMFLEDETQAFYSATLHWEPNIQDAIEVRTPDFEGDFVVVLEGITTTGKPVVVQTTVPVRQ